MLNAVDNVTVYRFIKKLATPFTKWRAFKHGIIDAHGNILKDVSAFENRNERDSFTKFDLLVLNIKKTMALLPGGSSKMASYAAALYLIKEDATNIFGMEDISEETYNNIMFELKNKTLFLEYVEYVVEDAPTNNISGGAIAGVRTDSYTPALHHHHRKKHKNKSEKSKENVKNV